MVPRNCSVSHILQNIFLSNQTLVNWNITKSQEWPTVSMLMFLRVSCYYVHEIMYLLTFSIPQSTCYPYTDFNFSLGVMTLSDWTDLTCCHFDQATCFFYTDSRNISQINSSDNCCKLTVSGEQLLQGKAGEELQTTIIIHCELSADNKMSQNVTITVWRICKLLFLTIVKQ